MFNGNGDCGPVPFCPGGNASATLDGDPRQRAREASKAKQILIDFAKPQECDKMRGTSLTTLIEDANKALADAFPDSSAAFVNTQKLVYGGLLLELNSLDAVGLLEDQQAKATFLGKMGESATIRPRQYNVVVYFVPLSSKAGIPEDMREVELANGLEPNSITATRWIRPLTTAPNTRLPPTRSSPLQTLSLRTRPSLNSSS